MYARSSGHVYVIGGVDAQTDEVLHDIWWRQVDGGGWHQMPKGDFQPGKVLAATRSYRDRKLWVLDEVRMGWIRLARLTRVDPGTGEAEVLGKWPRFDLFNKHWLVLDGDGSVLVAASSSRLRRHTLLRIRLDGASPQVDRVHFGRGVLATAPWADAAGYALPIARSGRLPKIIRLESLGGRRAKWSDMQGCLR